MDNGRSYPGIATVLEIRCLGLRFVVPIPLTVEFLGLTYGRPVVRLMYVYIHHALNSALLET